VLLTTCTRDELDTCRAFLASLGNGTDDRTAYILGVGRVRSDEHYLELLRLEAGAYGAEWSSSDDVRVLPVSEAEDADLAGTLRLATRSGGWQSAVRLPSIGYRRENGTPLTDALASLLPESMPLIFSGGGSTLIYREFAEGEIPDWPDGWGAILQGRPTLIVIDLDAVELVQTAAVVRYFVSDLERIAGIDMTSRFAAVGRAHMWNREKGEFFSPEETTRIVRAEREELAHRVVVARYGQAIPRERKASLHTAATVRGRPQKRTGPTMIRSAKMDALTDVAAARVPAFVAAILTHVRDWAGASVGRLTRELPLFINALHADIRNEVGHEVCVRFLGPGYPFRFPIWPSREIALDAPGRPTDGSGRREPKGARIGELATRQPEIGDDPLSSPSDDLDVLAAKAQMTEVERDLFFARAIGLSIPAWAQARGSLYRMHLSDAKKVWRRIIAKLRAVSD
jgi:hypothetical protein